MSKAREEWNTEHFRKDNQSDIEDQIAAARKEWIKSHNDELERRLANAIQEVRRIWDEEQKIKTKEVRKQRFVFLSTALLFTGRRRVFQLLELSRVAVLSTLCWLYLSYIGWNHLLCLVFCGTTLARI